MVLFESVVESGAVDWWVVGYERELMWVEEVVEGNGEQVYAHGWDLGYLGSWEEEKIL